MAALDFDILHQDSTTRARVGRVTTPHGSFDTPAFMPVGTQAAVKGLLPHLVAQGGAQIILANTYHLMLRPGSDLVARLGGLQSWMGWRRPMLTDSGGFQVFSLSNINRINEEGVVFKSHLDGSTVELTPARSIQVQNQLGADIIMAFDDCPPSVSRKGSGVGGLGPTDSQHATSDPRHPEPDTRVRSACERTVRWLAQCVAAHGRKAEQALFGIVQGGTDLALRGWCAQAVTQMDLPGYAIGGVAVGEDFAGMKAVVEHTAPLLPADRPRYLMGVGYPCDLVMAVRAGVDMFDCVLPTRNGRNANAFTREGQIRLRNAKFAEDPRPIEEGCDCPACGAGAGVWGRGSGQNPGPGPQTPAPSVSRSYLRHLFMAGEMLGPILVSLHNLRYFQRLMLDIRRAISDNDWSLVRRNWPAAGL